MRPFRAPGDHVPAKPPNWPPLPIPNDPPTGKKGGRR